MCVGFVVWGGQSAFAGELYELTVDRAFILPTKDNGKPWDVGCLMKRKVLRGLSQTFVAGKPSGTSWFNALQGFGLRVRRGPGCFPDPFVVLKVGGKTILTTKKRKNSLVPQWGKQVTVRLGRRSTLSVKVMDRDLRNHDPIGSNSQVVFTAAHRFAGGVLRLRFGRVRELRIMIRPASLPSPLHVRGRYAIDKAMTLRVNRPRLRNMNLIQRAQTLSFIRTMKVSIHLRKSLQAKMEIQAQPPGVSNRLHQKINGSWHISGKYILLKRNKRRGKGFTRCQLLFQRLVCSWWGSPLVLKRTSGR